MERAEYRPMAERAYAGRQNVDVMVTPVDDAARAIVDAILDDDAPLRVGCDPLSVGMLDAWRQQADEALQQLAVYKRAASGTALRRSNE